MKTKFLRIVSASTAVVLASLFILQPSADIKYSNMNTEGETREASAYVSQTVSAVESEANFQKLSESCAELNRNETDKLCSEFEKIISDELDKTSDFENTELYKNDEVVRERHDKYAAEVSVKAIKAKKAVEDIRKGSDTEKNLAVLNEMYGEDSVSFNSDATPSEVIKTGNPEVTEYRKSSLNNSGYRTLPDPPTQDDLNPVSDKSVSENLIALSKELGTAKKIYSYVHSNVRYEAYAGSKKGAAVTLEQLGGNDVDQSILLVAMLRSAGIPARFVSGTVEITAQQAVDITGAESAESAGRVLSSRYKNVKCMTSQGKISGFRMDQTWTEAYVSYTDYRGAGNNSGDKIWIPLDPSFKKLDVTEKVCQPQYSESQISLFDSYDKLADEYPGLYEKTDRCQDGITVKFRSVSQKDDGYLPDTLPYSVVTVNERYSSVSEDIKDSVSFSIDGEELGSKYLSDILAVPINITYEPATEKDREIMDSSESICDIPAYLVNVVPVVSFGNEEFRASKPVSLGKVQKLSTRLKNSSGTTILADDLVAGSYYAVNLDYQIIGVADSQKNDDELNRIKENAENPDVSVKDKYKMITSYIGKYYFILCDSDSSVLEKSFDVCKTRQLALTITGYEFNTSKTLGIVNSLENGSFFIDAAYNKYNVTSFSGDTEAERNFAMTLAYKESFNEGFVFKELFREKLDGISTASVFAKAEELGINSRYIVSKDHFDDLDSLNISSSVKSEIKDFVNRGQIVNVIPETISVGSWTGTAYIATDLKTGSSSYMLSGSRAGGSADEVFDYLYNVNMMIVSMSLCLSGSSIAYNTVKLYGYEFINDPVGITGSAISLLSAGKILGAAFDIHYRTIDFMWDYIFEGESALDRFAQYTLEKLNELNETINSLICGVCHDAGFAVLGLFSQTFSTVASIADNIYNAGSLIGSGSESGGDYSDEIDYSDLIPDINSVYKTIIDKLRILFG